MRAYNWTARWQELVRTNSIKLKMCDQDVYNAMVKVTKGSFHRMLHPGWNAQLWSVKSHLGSSQLYLLHGLRHTWEDTAFIAIFKLFSDEPFAYLTSKSSACQERLNWWRNHAPELSVVVHGHAY